MNDSIDIPIACIKCGKYGHHVTECQKKVKEKTKKKQDKVDIKPVTLQDLMTKAKMIKLEIKEIKKDNSTDINEQNIAEIINLKELSKLMTKLPLLEKDNDNIKQKFLSLNDRVIFQKWHTGITLVINKEFSLTKIASVDSGADKNCIQEGLIPLKYNKRLSERLIQANGENLVINKIPNVHICHDGIYFETVFVLIKDLPLKLF